MNIKIACFVLVNCILAASLKAVDVNEVIDKAREHLGTEAKLNGVKSLAYEGVVYDADGVETGRMSLKFKKNELQRLDLRIGSTVEVTAVNGYEGYVKRTDSEDSSNSDMVVLGSDQVRRLISNTYENLHFFKGPWQQRGGKISFVGEEIREGRTGYRLRFEYSNGLFYERVFDAETGELLVTMSGDNNHELVEKSAIRVDGIKFPKEVQTFLDGELIRRVVFESIKVNPEFDDSIFDFQY